MVRLDRASPGEFNSRRFPKEQRKESPASAAIRWALFWIFVLGMGGTATELILLGHTEGLLQWVPLALIR